MSTSLQDAATAAGGLITAGLAVAAFIKSNRAGAQALERRDAEINAQVQQRYEDERNQLMAQIKATYEEQISWLKGRVATLEELLRTHGLL